MRIEPGYRIVIAFKLRLLHVAVEDAACWWKSSEDAEVEMRNPSPILCARSGLAKNLSSGNFIANLDGKIMSKVAVDSDEGRSVWRNVVDLDQVAPGGYLASPADGAVPSCVDCSVGKSMHVLAAVVVASFVCDRRPERIPAPMISDNGELNTNTGIKAFFAANGPFTGLVAFTSASHKVFVILLAAPALAGIPPCTILPTHLSTVGSVRACARLLSAWSAYRATTTQVNGNPEESK